MVWARLGGMIGAGRLVLGVVALGMAAGAAIAEGLPPRPSGLELLPANTVAVLTCADTNVLRDKFAESSFFQMTNDQQLRPLISALYGNLVDTVAQAQERLGLRFDELLELTAGELTLAAVAPPQERPELILIADADPLSPLVPRLLEGLEAWVEDSGGTVTREQLEDMELTVCRPIPGPWEELVYFEQDETLIFATRGDLLRQLLLRWAGHPDEDDPGVLSDEQPFVVAMNNTAVQGDLGSQVRWWVDPIDLIFSLARGRLDAQLMLSVLPVLRVDDLEGIGGTISFEHPMCDHLSEIHVFVAPPHEGVWEVMATRSRKCDPETWVPADAASYLTFNLDTPQAMRALTTITDTLNGEGSLREQMRNGDLARRLGIDLRTDFWDHLTGRATYVTWFEQQPSLGAQRSLLGLHLRDVDAFQPALQQMVTKLGDRVQKESFAGVEMMLIQPRQRDGNENQPDRENRANSMLRPPRPQPAFAIVGDSLVVSDQPAMLKQAILVHSGQTPSLRDDPDFKLVADQLAEEAGDPNAVSISFRRPEPAFRNMYQVLQSKEVQELLARRAQGSSFWQNVQKSLQQHPLPPFAVLQKYLAPSGGVWTEVDTGWHYIGLAIRHENSL